MGRNYTESVSGGMPHVRLLFQATPKTRAMMIGEEGGICPWKVPEAF